MHEAIIKAPTRKHLKNLENTGIDINRNSVTIDKKDSLFRIDAVISDEDIKKLEDEGYTVEKISDLASLSKERLKEVSRTNRFDSINTMEGIEKFTIAGGYMNVTEIETALIQFNRNYPDLVELIELPNRTWEGRTSRAIRIHGGAGTNKPAVMFTGGVHAREWGTCDICIHFIRNILACYQSDEPCKYGNKTFTSDDIKTIVENSEIIIFPDVNPDGKDYSQRTFEETGDVDSNNVLWRKNRNPNPVPNPIRSDYHAVAGVDLNRNTSFLWSSGIGTEVGGRPIAEVYKGSGPFSEPESRNVKHLFDTYNNIKCFLDIHCHVGQILMSWGDDETQSIHPEQNYRNSGYDGLRGILCDEHGADFLYREYMHPSDLGILARYATKMSDALTKVRGRNYAIEHAVGLYPTSASNQDYAFSQRLPGDENRSRISAYTIEFGSRLGEEPEGHFIPAYNVMQDIMTDVCSALTELCLAVSKEENST
jgi:carboxypeptidase T